MPPGAHTTWPSLPQPTLAGRAREHIRLRASLQAALAGKGSLVLISGEAGIGKTALARALADDAAACGCLVLAGAYYDGATTSPYGPWLELISESRRRGDLPQPPTVLQSPDAVSQAPTSGAIVTALRAAFDQLVERGPIMLLLEDAHWADPESLEFLRVFTREISNTPILVVATYRDEDLALNQGLYHLVPHLVRESAPLRIELRGLDASAVETIISQRYDLSEPDRSRLASHLESRSQGIPLFLLELLRTLEEEQRLRPTSDGWTLGEVDTAQVPVLIKQVIDGRIDRLDLEIRRLLELAAVIGSDIPLLLWRRVSGTGDDLFSEAIEQATRSHVLEAAPSRVHVRFTHALVRDSLYEGIPLPRRQMWHRRLAEALVNEAGYEPDVVAHHFREALDPRAVEWFIRAGDRTERIASVTAARHFEMALEMMSGDHADPAERGWLLLRRAGLLRNAEPRTALAILDTAQVMALEAGDMALQAYVTCYRGQMRCLSGEMKLGIANLEQGVTALSRLAPDDLARVTQFEQQHNIMSRAENNGYFVAILADVGRIDEALARTQAAIESGDVVPPRAWWARGIALALIGLPTEANEAFVRCREALRNTPNESAMVNTYLYQISLVQIPYGADDVAERRRLGAEGEAAWLRSGDTYGDVSPRLTRLRELVLEGDWQEALELALNGLQSSETSEKHLFAVVSLAQLARTRGDAALAWQQIHKMLPAGYHTIPGHDELATALALMRLAASLCLDAEDLTAAHAWLDAHDRWLSWSGSVLGKADGQILWAYYYRSAGNVSRALEHAAKAILLASAPRQPLSLLAAHRLHGELQTQIGELANARQNLNAALALAEACAAIYERALTLVAIGELERRSAAPDAATALLKDARSTFETLGAIPALELADELAARLAEGTVVDPFAGFGLTPREVEVLRLIAKGGRNRDIADELFLSARTVERHIANLYLKIGATSRAEAIAFAFAHDLH